MSSQGERTPLLLPPSASCSPSQHDGPSSASKEAAGPTKAGRPDLLIRALITTFLWSLSIYIPAAAILDALRSYTCAAFYERNGELIPSWSINGTVGTPGPAIGHGHDQLTNIFSVEAGLGEHPCALPTIEAQVGHFVLITRLLYTGLGAASMLFFGPMLSSLGRKPLAILSLISSALVVLPNIVLPLGYPFSPAGTPLSISPNVSLAVILFANILGGVTGTTLLPELVFQVLIVDISTPATRSRYLTWLAAAKYVGASAGPALANLATELFPHAMAFGSSHSHSRGNRHLRHDHRDVAVAPPEKGWKTHTNTAPFWLTLLLCGAAVVYIWVAVPETVRRDEKEGEVSHKAVAEPGSKRGCTNLFSTLTALKPKPIAGQPGKYDWRLFRIAIVMLAVIQAALAFTQVMMICGYELDWGPEKVGSLLSAAGASRTVILIFAIPLVTKLLERLISRPSEIRDMRPHELDALAKFTPGMTEPSPESVDVDVDGGVGLGVGQSESHSHSPCASGIYCSRVSGYGSGYEPDGLLAPVNSSSIMGPCACSLESSGIVLHFSNMDEQQEAKRALTLWRADIDLALASASFAVDMLAWIVITAAVSSRNGAAIFAGYLTVCIGAGGLPALQSAAIAIVNDMEGGQAGVDAYLAAMSLIDGLTQVIAPVLDNFIYTASLNTFPAAACLFSALLFGIAVVLVATVGAHAHARGGGGGK